MCKPTEEPLLLGVGEDNAMTSPDPELHMWEAQRGPGSGPGSALGSPVEAQCPFG